MPHREKPAGKDRPQRVPKVKPKTQAGARARGEAAVARGKKAIAGSPDLAAAQKTRQTARRAKKKAAGAQPQKRAGRGKLEPIQARKFPKKPRGK